MKDDRANRILGACLASILDGVESIRSFTSETKSLREFEEDERTISAVVAQIIKIGEAAKDIPEADRERHPNIPWSLIAGMRDVLAHRYWSWDPSEIWKVIKEDLDPLEEASMAIIDSHGFPAATRRKRGE